jgi:hypothetical protein
MIGIRKQFRKYCSACHFDPEVSVSSTSGEKSSFLYIAGTFLSIFFFSDFSYSQTIDSTAYKQYTFIKKDLNRISNDSSSLSFLYEKLAQLEKEKKGRVNIVHIGDSHIQADNFSGLLRQKLQLHFGNAGRGLVFPYRVAKSNEPTSYRTGTNVIWDAKRNVFPDKPLPIGLCGFTVETRDSVAEMSLMVKDQPGLGYAFSKFTLFHEKGMNNFDLSICDDENCEKGVFRPTDKSTSPFVSELVFDRPMRQIIVRNISTDTSKHASTRIYGMMVENDSAGVLYNMIGVNGAEFKHYNMSKYFFQQFSYLSADLVIVSLGTNEAFYGGLNGELFYRNIDTTISNIRSVAPNASILLTTPGDSFKRSRKGRIKNPDVKVARETIIKYALDHNLAYWDLYEIMGGYGSMAKWYAMKIAQRDRVHFTGRGYQIQGDLLYNAFMKSFEEYKKKKF